MVSGDATIDCRGQANSLSEVVRCANERLNFPAQNQFEHIKKALNVKGATHVVVSRAINVHQL
jgi:hypothetical protein